MAQLFAPHYHTILDTNGTPVSGGYVRFYTSGTTTPATVYSDAGLTTPLGTTINGATGVAADSAGRLPAIYLDSNVDYRIREYDASNVLIRDTDPLTSVRLNLTGVTDNASFVYTSGNAEAYGIRVQSASVTHQVDGMLAIASFQGASAAGYGFHSIVTVDASVPANAAGAVGGAIGGVGTGNAVVGNIRDGLTGSGVIGTAADTSSGAGVTGTFQSTGTGAGVKALKQNTNGAAGGPNGTGPALEATNSSEQGAAIESYTESNNASAVSNVFERRNVVSGIINRLQVLLGGARTGALKGLEILIEPATALTGTSAVSAAKISLNSNVSGSASASGLEVSNAATGGTAAYGMQGVCTGTNTDNYGVYGNASGGTRNWSLYGVGKSYVGSLAVGNAAAATTPGTVTKKIEVFDAAGASLGFVAVYGSIA